MNSDTTIQKRTKEILVNLKSCFLQFNCPQEYLRTLNNIIESLSQPCRLAITGRVKAGKSTLINVLLDGEYAKVGVSETTATINIFKYGKPKDLNTPILCKYISGKEVWISKAQLDSLQGYSADIVTQISEIESLTYYLEDERLKNVTLIDTPGIDAVVGDDGEAHQEQTECYLGLRKRHKDQTIEYSNNADAIILLLGDVTHENDLDFINGFLDARGQSSNINSVGVLSQIDLSPERIENRDKNAKERYNRLSKYLNCVIPISAGLYHYLPSFEDASKIKQTLNSIPSEKLLTSILLRSSASYFKEHLLGIDIPLKKRQEIYPPNIPFRCFAVIAEYLYKYDVKDALSLIKQISGMERLKSVLDSHLFNRCFHIKSEYAIRQTLLIIWDLLNCHKKAFSVHDSSEPHDVASKIHDYQLQLEQLKRECGNANTYFQSLLQLYENSHQFTENEFEELKHLFSDNLSFDESRMNFWFGQSIILMNEAKRNIAKQAYNKYNDLIFK